MALPGTGPAPRVSAQNVTRTYPACVTDQRSTVARNWRAGYDFSDIGEQRRIADRLCRPPDE
jgi:hypothetical protein